MAERFEAIPGFPDAYLADIPLWLPSLDRFRDIVTRTLAATVQPECLRIFTLNPEMTMHACRHAAYKFILRQGNCNVVDGMGVAVALRFRGIRVPTRLSGADIIYALAEAARDCGRPMLFLGGRPDRLDKACENMKQLVPRLTAVGVSPPYKEYLPLANHEQVCELIRSLRPAAIAVCLGIPKQEQWIVENRQLLSDADVRIVGGFGGTADFLSGEVRRAPRWIRKGGLEWVYRLIQEPWRFKRQVVTLPFFAARALFSPNFARKHTKDRH